MNSHSFRHPLNYSESVKVEEHRVYFRLPKGFERPHPAVIENSIVIAASNHRATILVFILKSQPK